jgi:hypothetical protein
VLSVPDAAKGNIRKIHGMSFEDLLKSSQLDPLIVGRSYREKGNAPSHHQADT